MSSIGKETEAVNAYLIKNSRGEGEEKKKKKKTGGGGGRKAVGRTGRSCMGV